MKNTLKTPIYPCLIGIFAIFVGTLTYPTKLRAESKTPLLPAQTQTYHYRISKISCSSCQQKIEGALQQIDGVQKITIHLKKKVLDLVVDSSKIHSPSIIEAKLIEAGFPGTPISL